MKNTTNKNSPIILVLDVETAPILGWVWGLWENTLGLNQVKSDWHLLSWAAKYYTDAAGKTWGPHKQVMYQDQRNQKNIEDDSVILKNIWKLLNSVDIIITQNGRRFDIKKLNARFVLNGMTPPSPSKQIDTLCIVKKHFNLTSNKLEFLTAKLCKKYKKLTHKEYPGFELWKACLAHDEEAWDVMQRYNVHDILSLEELYHKLAPWDKTVDFSLYTNDLAIKCNCGSTAFQRRGYAYSSAGRYCRFQCKGCGAWSQDKKNMLDKDKKASLRKNL